ncbi:hypothetical protein GUJ93_ZPchr0012g21309 [Zizania palustris]|uniref:Pentatricopeptide repeat-containing protein n=1 Tax=Zizania palustris TaxID=103762 RepID=A0A8J5WWR5_ZIZPA|nr:hypothetical protein GUJ93_ZPchr0012g21309 [Zizania palustris]
MASSRFQADEVSLSSVISACSRLDNLFSFGEFVHSSVIKLGYVDTASCPMANSMITFYYELGFLEAVEEVFLSISNKNLVTWNAMIKGLVDNERVNKVMCMFQEMRSKYHPDVATLITISACGDHGLLPEVKGK